MKLQIQSIHFVADEALLDFVQKRIDKLETFYDRFVDGEVILREVPGDPNENKMVDVKLNVPGGQLFAKEQNGSFEAAIDKAVEALRRQIRKHKEKTLSHH